MIESNRLTKRLQLLPTRIRWIHLQNAIWWHPVTSECASPIELKLAKWEVWTRKRVRPVLTLLSIISTSRSKLPRIRRISMIWLDFKTMRNRRELHSIKCMKEAKWKTNQISITILGKWLIIPQAKKSTIAYMTLQSATTPKINNQTSQRRSNIRR